MQNANVLGMNYIMSSIIKKPHQKSSQTQFAATFLTVRMTECYYRLSRKVLVSPCLKILKTGHSPEQPALADTALSRGTRPDNLQMCACPQPIWAVA